MIKIKDVFIILFLALVNSSHAQSKEFIDAESELEKMMVRIAEIEIHPEYLEEYIAILKLEAEASVRLEQGVICIYPMYQKDSPTKIRLLEIYADNKAYQSHLQTPHFKHYKNTTLKMVKSLKLVDMEAIDKEAMPKLFQKI